MFKTFILMLPPVPLEDMALRPELLTTDPLSAPTVLPAKFMPVKLIVPPLPETEFEVTVELAAIIMEFVFAVLPYKLIVPPLPLLEFA